MAGTVYGMTFSTCTQRIFVVANELGLDLNLTTVNLMAGENRKPEYLARQV